VARPAPVRRDRPAGRHQDRLDEDGIYSNTNNVDEELLDLLLEPAASNCAAQVS
jgi:hypothetical protein